MNRREARYRALEECIGRLVCAMDEWQDEWVEQHGERDGEKLLAATGDVIQSLRRAHRRMLRGRNPAGR